MDKKSVDEKIKSLSDEMDLVMINEYFDESLILLKRCLCWDFSDMVYVAQLIRKKSSRIHITPDLARRMREWNHADVKLYQHFNETLWERVRDYGPAFQRDLRILRERNADISRQCLANVSVASLRASCLASCS